MVDICYIKLNCELQHLFEKNKYLIKYSNVFLYSIRVYNKYNINLDVKCL